MALSRLQIQCFAPEHCARTIARCKSLSETFSVRSDCCFACWGSWSSPQGSASTKHEIQTGRTCGWCEVKHWAVNRIKSDFSRFSLAYVVTVGYFTVTVCRWRLGFKPHSVISASWQMWATELMLASQKGVSQKLSCFKWMQVLATQIFEGFGLLQATLNEMRGAYRCPVFKLFRNFW